MSIGFIGCGKIAQAIIKGFITAGKRLFVFISSFKNTHSIVTICWNEVFSSFRTVTILYIEKLRNKY